MSIGLMVGAAVTAVLVARRGCLRRSVFDDSPMRITGLAGVDLGIWVAYMGAIVVMSLLPRSLGGEDAGTTGPATPREQMLTALMSQMIVELPVVVYAIWKSNLVVGGARQLGLWMRKPGRDLRTGFVALAAATVMVLGLNASVTSVSTALGREAPKVGHHLLEAMQDSKDVWTVVGLVGSAVVVAPVLEECIFRGFVQTCLLNTLGPGRRWWIVVAGAGLFTSMHYILPWQVLPGIFVLGVVLGWVYERTGSLVPAILVHAGFNALNVGVVLALERGEEVQRLSGVIKTISG